MSARIESILVDPYQIISWAWIAIFIIWMAAAVTSKRTVRRAPIGFRLAQAAMGVAAGSLFFGWGQERTPLGYFLIRRSMDSAYVGLTMTLAGLAFTLWARFVLGRNWSGTVTVKENHELVRSGPYRLVRHPIYTGFLFALLGTAIVRGDLSAFLGFALATLTLKLKSLTEESFMTDQFGEQYATYKQGVKALIPYVW
jgi:protein-S-isoprenylcysteine O-methyltransferase Ste14